MTDMYAAAGIPMPPKESVLDDKAWEDSVAEGPVNPEKTGPENVEDQPWFKHEERERERQLRLRCTEIVFTEMQGTSTQLLQTVEKVYDFVKNGPSEPKPASED